MRICGAASDVTAKSIQSEAASVSSPSPISLQPLNDVTPAHAVTVLCDQQHRFAGETTASQRQGRGAASEHARPRRRIPLRRAVRRIDALLRSHQHTDDVGAVCPCAERLSPPCGASRPQCVPLSSETIVRGAGCPSGASPDLWEPRVGNRPRPPGRCANPTYPGPEP